MKSAPIEARKTVPYTTRLSWVSSQCSTFTAGLLDLVEHLLGSMIRYPRAKSQFVYVFQRLTRVRGIPAQVVELTAVGVVLFLRVRVIARAVMLGEVVIKGIDQGMTILHELGHRFQLLLDLHLLRSELAHAVVRVGFIAVEGDRCGDDARELQGVTGIRLDKTGIEHLYPRLDWH